jgi:hypothetical protein
MVVRNPDIASLKALPIELSELLPLSGPAIQIFQFDIEYRALESIHAIVVANAIVKVALGFPVGTHFAGEPSDRVIVGGERATLAVCA